MSNFLLGFLAGFIWAFPAFSLGKKFGFLECQKLYEKEIRQLRRAGEFYD